MQKIHCFMFSLIIMICLFSSCTPITATIPSVPDHPLPVEIVSPDSSFANTDDSNSDRLQHILDSLDLCIAFVEDVNSHYPEVQIPLDTDELSWYYTELDSNNPDYDTIEALLSVLTLRLRQSAHARIDNICKMGNPVPEGLYDLLDEYNILFHTLGW